MNVLITGSSSDISTSIQSHLESKGDQVYFTTHQINLDPAQLNKQTNKIPFDLSKPSAHESELDNLLSALNPSSLQGLILNAATPTYRLAPLDQINWQELDTFLQANIQGNLWLLRKILPIFVKKKFGRIIFMSSMSNQRPVAGYAGYALAKSALETTMKYIAHEFGHHNITANTLRLGIFKTARTDKFIRRSSLREKMEASVSLKRLGSPADLHPAIDMLLDKNCYAQGSVIDISGGIAF